MTNAGTLRSFEEILDAQNPGSDYFEACFRIQGMDRNSMNIDLLHVNSLPASSFFGMGPGSEESP
jgi:hypothetical protein